MPTKLLIRFNQPTNAMTTIPAMSMILAEAEEGRPRVYHGRTNTIEHHEFFARQFAIFSASRGDDFTGVINTGDVSDVRPVGMTISISGLRDWHYDLRRGDFNAVGGIDAVKRAVVAAGGTMDALERRAELSELPDFFQKYKEMKGDSFDGTMVRSFTFAIPVSCAHCGHFAGTCLKLAIVPHGGGIGSRQIGQG